MLFAKSRIILEIPECAALPFFHISAEAEAAAHTELGTRPHPLCFLQTRGYCQDHYCASWHADDFQQHPLEATASMLTGASFFSDENRDLGFRTTKPGEDERDVFARTLGNVVGDLGSASIPMVSSVLSSGRVCIINV